MFHQPALHAVDIDWSEEFQERRRDTWRKSRFAFALLAIGAVAMCIPMFELYATPTLVAASLWIYFMCYLYYRCPSCNDIPAPIYKSTGGRDVVAPLFIAFDPEFCSNCGVRLRPKFRARHG